MTRAIRLHRGSAGLDLGELRPGRDILLNVDPAHGLDLPHGVLIDDYLDLELRAEIDDAASEALARWRRVHDGPLTVGGICLPWLWEMELYASVFLPALREAVGLRRALAAHDWPAVELRMDDESLEAVVEASGGFVAEARRLEPLLVAKRPRRRRNVIKGLRRTVKSAAGRSGVPSVVRPGAVIVAGYWHLVPVVDRMLESRLLRPALALQAPLPGPRRSLRIAARGGWVGLPGPLQRRWAKSLAARLRDSIVPVPLDGLECSVGEVVSRASRRFVADHAPRDLAYARLLGRCFRRREIGGVVVPFDTRSEERLMVTIAQSFGVPTIVVQHGAYLERERFPDLQIADTVALWSVAALPSVAERADRSTVVGYPSAVPPRHEPPAESPHTITVLGDSTNRVSSLRDARIVQRHYAAAIEASLDAVPKASIVLRPHPSSAPGTAEAMCEGYPRAKIVVDTTTNILDLLADSHLCIGTNSTATLQAALVDTPVVVLNLGGTDFPWPLGGGTTVPVAHSREELATILHELVAGDGGQHGRDDLLAALGVMPGDAPERLYELIAQQVRPIASRPDGSERVE